MSRAAGAGWLAIESPHVVQNAVSAGEAESLLVPSSAPRLNPKPWTQNLKP